MLSVHFRQISVVLWLVCGGFAILIQRGSADLRHVYRVAVFGLWMAFSITVIGLREIWLGTDTVTYLGIFEAVSADLYVPSNSEAGFYWLIRAASLVVPPNLIFVIVQLAFVGCLGIALWRTARREWPVLLFLYLGCFFYYTACINIIRSGLAVAVFLSGLAVIVTPDARFPTKRELVAAAIICFGSALIHHFNFLYAVMFATAVLVRSTRIAVIAWLAAVGLTIAEIDLAAPAAGVLGEADTLAAERVSRYLQSASHTYRTGMRWDFLLFSGSFLLFPLIYIFKYRYSNAAYDLLTRTYLYMSALFVASFHHPFSDRVGLLSFFLIPLLIAFPAFDRRFQHRGLARSIALLSGVGLGIFTFFLTPGSFRETLE